MSEVVLVAIAAAIGNFLQGWDNSALAGKYLSEIKYACLLFYIYIYIYMYVCMYIYSESFANKSNSLYLHGSIGLRYFKFEKSLTLDFMFVFYTGKNLDTNH